jgi:hypothetical protein
VAANPDALVMVDIALRRHGFQQLGAFCLVHRLGGDARRQARQALPIHAKKIEGGLVGVIENRLFGRVMGQHGKRRRE